MTGGLLGPHKSRWAGNDPADRVRERDLTFMMDKRDGERTPPMLGRPDRMRACLFDRGGVPTPSAAYVDGKP